MLKAQSHAGDIIWHLTWMADSALQRTEVVGAMGDMWTGEKVRLRGVEPDDWEGFRDLAQHTVDVRNADLVEPPRSEESFRMWTAERAERPPGGEAFRPLPEATLRAGFTAAAAAERAQGREPELDDIALVRSPDELAGLAGPHANCLEPVVRRFSGCR